MSDPILRLQGIARDFHDGVELRRVIQKTDLDIYPGEFTIIAGPSGSGKTTLMTLMGLILRPSEGTVYIRDIKASGCSETKMATLRQQNYGFVFQLSELLPALSVMENIVVANGIQGSSVASDIKKKALDLLKDFNLLDCLHLRPLQLSGGQKQRVAIVRALVNDPAVLLCDEPTSALDAESSQIVLDALKQLSKDKTRGLIMVTHDPRVFPYADRLIKIEDGIIIYDSHTSKEQKAL